MNLKVLQVTITDFINQENVGNLSDGAGWVEWHGRPIIWSSVVWCLLIDVLKISLGHQREESMLVSHGKSHGMIVNVSNSPLKDFCCFLPCRT
jgi:hypothetical protein